MLLELRVRDPLAGLKRELVMSVAGLILESVHVPFCKNCEGRVRSESAYLNSASTVSESSEQLSFHGHRSVSRGLDMTARAPPPL